MSQMNYGSLVGELNDPNGTQNPLFYGIAIPVFAIMLPIFFARIYTRTFPTVRLSWDDLFLTLAVIFESALFAMSLCVAIETGGRHIVFIPLPKIQWVLEIGFFIFIITPITNALIKISLCLMVIRIKRHSRAWVISMWAMMIILSAVIVASTLTTIVSCLPVSAFWVIAQRLAGGNECWPISVIVNISFGFGSFFVFTDLIMAMLPIAFVQDIQMPFRNKVILCALMASGLFAMGAGIAKIFLLKKVYTGEDYIYELSLYGVFLHLELLIGIIAACVPTLRAPFERMLKRFGMLPSMISTSKRRTNHTGESSGTVTSSYPGMTVGRKDATHVEGSVSWESESADGKKRDYYSGV